MTAPRSPATILPIDKASPEAQSANLVEGNLEQLKALFPEAFTEGRVDFEVLKQLLGAAVDEREEKYGLNWHGKRRARQLALTPSTGTLRPCPEESVDWDTTQNLFIEGDNLEVLKLLQKSYAGKVKLIYIDPPYNTGRDFVYPDNFQDSIKNYLELTGQVEGGQRLSSNTDASGRFHTDWLNMIYPRLKLARGLLKEDGVICISIDDGEEANLRKVCDEVFGEENHVATIVWQKRYVSNVTAQWLSDMHDFIVVYAKAKESLSVNSWDRTEDQLAAYKNPDGDPRGKWRAQDLSASKPYAAGMFSIVGPTGLTFDPPPNRYWRCSRQQFDAWVADGRIWWGVNKDARPMLKSFLDESERGITPHTWWEHEFAGHNKEATLELKELFAGDAPFDTPKPVKLMKRLIQLFSGGGDLLMDFFCGSAAFGHAAQELASVTGRPHRFVLVQLPEKTDNRTYPTIADIAKERLRRSGKLVRDQAPLAQVDVGFRVFKLDSSNVRAWNPRPDDLSGTLLDHAEHLAADRSEQDVLHELLLKLGLDLSVPMESRQIAGKTVHSIGAGALMACLSDGIDRDVAEPLALGIAEWQKAQAQALQGGDDNAKPVSTKLVFKDSAFADDVAKTNLAAILSQHGLDDVRSI